jgi:hypothetical protein
MEIKTKLDIEGEPYSKDSADNGDTVYLGTVDNIEIIVSTSGGIPIIDTRYKLASGLKEDGFHEKELLGMSELTDYIEEVLERKRVALEKVKNNIKSAM